MVDRYTKAVLTVIAACLVWLCAMTAGRPVSAQANAVPQTVQPVILVGTGTVDRDGRVEIVYKRDTRRTDPTVPVSAAQSLPVTLPYTAADPMPARVISSEKEPLAIEIASVRKSRNGAWEPLRAAVEDAALRPRPGGGDRR
jgi:hypothetical protein